MSQNNETPAGNNSSTARPAPQSTPGSTSNHHGRKLRPYYNQQPAMYVPSPDYMSGGYPSAPYQASYYPGQQYYMNPGYQQTGYRPDYPQHHLNLTTAAGEKVELNALNNTPKGSSATLNRSTASTPKTASAQLGHQRTPSVTSPAATAATTAPVDEGKQSLRDAFKKQVAERAAKLQKEKEAAEKKAVAAKAESTQEPSTSKTAESSPAPDASTVSESSVATDSKSEITPVTTPVPASEPVEDKEAAIRAFKEKIAAKVAKPEAAVEAIPAEPVAETFTETAADTVTETPAKVEEVAEKELPAQVAGEAVKTPEVEAESTPAAETSATDVIATTPAPVAATEKKEVPVEETSEKTEVEHTTEESTESEQKTEEPTGLTITKFFKNLEIAKTVEDPFTFTYPDGMSGPEVSLKKEGCPSYRYDPVFLLSLRDKCHFPIDDDFKEKIKFISVSTRGDRSSSIRGGFKFGQGSGLSGSQGFSKSSSNLRKFDLNSRSNSRTNSKRRGGSGRGGDRGDRKSNRNRDRGDDREREPELPPPENYEPLKKSANRWIPKSRAAKTDEEQKFAPDGTPLLTESEANRKIKSLLNKLTLEYFEDITDDILAIANQSKYEENAETLKLVLNSTFDKATDEPHWSNMYAQFCAKMCKVVDSEVKDAEIPDRDGNPLSGGALVRKLLLSKCQTEYQKGWSDKLPTNVDGTPVDAEMMTDEYYAAAAAKRRGLGLVRFIGHLYVLGLLSEKIIFICLIKLVENVEDPSEDTVENLIQLIKTVGQKLDGSGEESRSKFNQLFQKVSVIAEAKIPSRLQFALMDLIDLKKRHWRGGEADKGPKTISQIHEEENRKHAEDQRNNDRRRQNKSESRANSSRNAGWGNSRVSDSDFKRVGQMNSSASSSNLGPTNNFRKSTSSRSKAPSSTSAGAVNTTPTPVESRENSRRPEQNRFALLNAEDEPAHEDEEDDEEEQEQETVESEEPKQEEQVNNEVPAEDN